MLDLLFDIIREERVVWYKSVLFWLSLLYIIVGLYGVIREDRVSNEVLTKSVNVLPINDDKELKDPKEVRQYVGAMAIQKGVSLAKVDHIVKCESRWDRYAVSKSGTYVGIFQISKIHGLGDDRYDVIKSTKWSLDKMKREGYSAWSCSTL